MKTKQYYNYTNYRKLLQDLFEDKKKKDPYLSYRAFAKRAGIKSPNYLQQVIKGSRNLTQKTILQVAKGFKLGKSETEYLENLVFMNQGDTVEEKEYYYYKIVKTRQVLKHNKLLKKQLTYYSEWYNVAIREMIVFHDGKLSTKQIAEKLYPKVPAAKVKTAVKLLEELHLIRKDKDNKWKQTSAHVSTGDIVDSMMVAKFHKNMSRLAMAAMEKVDPDFCNISAVTIPAEKKTFSKVIRMLSGIRKEMLKMSEEIEDPDEIMQINFHMFPLTKVEGKKNGQK